MNKERIQNVIKALRETPHKDRFTMSTWGHACGTPACAIGNYAARTDLQDAFLLVGKTQRHHLGARLISTTGSTYSLGLDEVQEHFDLTERETEGLFGPDGCGGARTTEEAIAFLEWYLTKPERAVVPFLMDSDLKHDDDY